MKAILFSLFNHPLAKSVIKQLNLDSGIFIMRSFPDKETYLRIMSSVKGKDIILLDSLDNPNNKILPLIFFAKTVKQLGAKKVGLISPYLAYMRQDMQFKSGESITSNYFSELLSNSFDWLLTVDPHLHRHHNLSGKCNISGVL